MNIYILNLNKLAFLILKPISSFGIKVNYLNNLTNNNANLHKNSNLNAIRFNEKNISAKRLFKLIDCGEDDVLKEQIKKFLPEKILKEFQIIFLT